eukprot:5767140-Alexandrium_andersonii.AAC.1
MQTLQAELESQHGISARRFVRDRYACGHEGWAAVALGTPGSHFSWKGVWRRPDVVLYVARLWSATRRLAHD